MFFAQLLVAAGKLSRRFRKDSGYYPCLMILGGLVGGLQPTRVDTFGSGVSALGGLQPTRVDTLGSGVSALGGLQPTRVDTLGSQESKD